MGGNRERRLLAAAAADVINPCAGCRMLFGVAVETPWLYCTPTPLDSQSLPQMGHDATHIQDTSRVKHRQDNMCKWYVWYGFRQQNLQLLISFLNFYTPDVAVFKCRRELSLIKCKSLLHIYSSYSPARFINQRTVVVIIFDTNTHCR